MSDAPTSGPTTVDPFMTGAAPEPMTEEQTEAALAAAFGQRSDQFFPPSDASQAASEETEEETGSPEGGEEEEGSEEGSEQSPSGAAGGEPADFATLFQQAYGREPTPQDVQALLGLNQWATSLDENQQAAVDWAINNPQIYQEYVAQQITGGGPGAPGTGNIPVTPPVADTPTPPEEIADDPAAMALWNMFNERFSALSNNVQSLAQNSLEAQQRQTVSAIGAGIEDFKTLHPNLTPQEIGALQSAVTQRQLLPGYVNSTGDPRKGMTEAMEALYWQTPYFRDKEIQARIAATNASEEQHTQRRRKASSVSGTGGNGASRTAKPPTTPDGRWGAVTAELREAMNNGQREE